MRRLAHYVTRPVAYPTTTVYVAGVALAVGIAEHVVPLWPGVLGLTLITIVALWVAMVREVRDALDIVNHDVLDRMTELLAVLNRVYPKDTDSDPS